MYNISIIDITDFYFNGRYASELECMVAGEGGYSSFSITPSMEDKVDKLMGVDGEIFISSSYNPRTFTIPLYIQNSDRIREISSWLGVKTPKDFYFRNDKIKLKAKLDGVLDIRNYLHEGLCEIKFKALTPYFIEINPLQYNFTNFNRGYNFLDPLTFYNPTSLTNYSTIQISPRESLSQVLDSKALVNKSDILCYTDGLITKTTNSIQVNNGLAGGVLFWNDGLESSRPLIKIYGNGDITCGLNGYSFTIKSITDYAYIDFQYYTVYKSSTLNMLPNFVGNFQEFNMLPGWNSFTSNNATKVEFTPRSRWI